MNIPANKRSEFFENFVPGIAGAAAALALWPISYVAAQMTITEAHFINFWMGATSIATGLGAAIGTGTAICCLAYSALVVSR